MRKAGKIFTWKMLAGAVAFNVLFFLFAFYLFPDLSRHPEKAYRLVLFLPQIWMCMASEYFLEMSGFEIYSRMAWEHVFYAMLIFYFFSASLLASYLYVLTAVCFFGLFKKSRLLPSRRAVLRTVALLGGIFIFAFALTGTASRFRPKRPGPHRPTCASNINQVGLSLAVYAYVHDGEMPTGSTSGEVFRILLETEFFTNVRLLSCSSNPIDEIDLDDPEGVSYWIDPDMPAERHEKRAIMADRAPWQLNHDGEGVNVLFEDFTVKFIRPGDSGPPDRISNPYIEEDTDIYANTGDPYKHAWIRWEREPVE